MLFRDAVLLCLRLICDACVGLFRYVGSSRRGFSALETYSLCAWVRDLVSVGFSRCGFSELETYSRNNFL